MLKYWCTHPDHAITKAQFGAICSPVYKKALSIINITNGFRAAGFYPFDSTAISDSAFAPSLVTFEEKNALHSPIVQQEADLGPLVTTHHPTTSAHHIDHEDEGEAGTAPTSSVTTPFSDEVGVSPSASSKDDHTTLLSS